MVTRGKCCGQGELNEDGQKVQISNYKISTNNIMYTVINIINTIAKYERVNPKSSHHKENMFYSPSLILYL